MGKIRFKLQNIVFEDNNGLGEKWKMMYRGNRMIYNKLLSAYTLKNGQFVEFLRSIFVRFRSRKIIDKNIQ